MSEILIGVAGILFFAVIATIARVHLDSLNAKEIAAEVVRQLEEARKL